MEKYFVLLIGLVMMITSVIHLKNSIKVRKWPVVKGKMLEKKVIWNLNMPGLQPRGFRYQPVVSYRYTVNGKTHIGHLVTYPMNWANKETVVQKFLDKLPDEVEVRYDPKIPETAALFPTSWFYPSLSLILGLLTSTMGLGLIGLSL